VIDSMQVVVAVLVVTATIVFGCKLIFAAWFEAKARFVKHLHNELGERGDDNGAD
jgi:hypothetical protein